MHLHRNHVSDYKHPGIKFHGQSVFSIGGCSSTRESKTLTKAKFKVKSDHRLQLIRYCIAKVILPYPFLLQEKQRNRFFSIFYLAINAGSLLSTIITPMLRGKKYLKWTLIFLFLIVKRSQVKRLSPCWFVLSLNSPTMPRLSHTS